MKEQIITGLWKFHERVPIETLKKLAESWSKEDPSYMQLYIRQVSKDQHGIGFMYDNTKERDSESSYDKYFDETTDKLKKQFGNDLVGWDISSSTIIIK